MSKIKAWFEEKKPLKHSKQGILRVVSGRTLIIILLLAVQFAVLLGIMFSFAQGFQFVYGGVMVSTAVMLIYVLYTKENPSIKLSWCFIIAVLPVFGGLLYLFVKTDLGHRIEQRVIQRTIDESVCLYPEQAELMERIKAEDKSFYNLAKYLKSHGGFSVYENTEVEYYSLGEHKLDAVLEELEKAEKFIFIEYFIIDRGSVWDEILEVLKRKAAEGVEVRLMYDGTCAISKLPYDYPKQIEKLGIKCRVFSPFRPFVSTLYNNRDHRKILVIDGRVAFTGGVNLADEYANRIKRFGHWKDTAIKLEGEAVKSFTLMFLQMWNSMGKVHNYKNYLDTSANCCSGEGYVIPFGDSPMDSENVGEMVYIQMLNEAKDYVYIMTPYLILDNEMLTAIKFAAGRGVDVRLILPHIPDHKYAFVLAQGHYRELHSAGVKIYEYLPGFVHAKMFLSDNEKAVVGTINLDYRSLYLHFECAAYLYKTPVIKKISEDFCDTFEKCRLITKEDINKRGIISKIVGVLLKVAAPLM